MGIVIVIERNLLCTMVSFRKKTHDGQTTWIVQRNNKKIVFSKRTKNKLEKMFFFTVNEHFFEQTLKTIVF